MITQSGMGGVVVCVKDRFGCSSREAALGFGPTRMFLQVDLFWWLGSVSLAEVGPFFCVPKGWLLPGFCWVLFQRSVSTLPLDDVCLALERWVDG